MQSETGEIISRLSKRLLLLCFSGASYGQAQCVNRAELLALSGNAIAQPYPVQIEKIGAILTDWTRCRYPKDSSYVNLSLELAKVKFLTGDLKGAIRDLNQTIRIYAGQNSPILKKEDLIKAYYRLGFCWKELNDYEEAERASKKAVALNQEALNSRWAAFAFGTLAYISYSKGEYQQALQYAERGKICAKRSGNHIAYLETWTESIKALLALNERVIAQRSVDSAIVMARADADAQYNLAVLLMQNAKLATLNATPKAALTYYKEALQINQRLSNNAGIVNSCISLGYLLYRIGDYEKAKKYYRLGLKTVTDPYVKLRLLDNLGAVFWQKKQYRTALTYYQTGLMGLPIRFKESDVTALPKPEVIRSASQQEFLLTLMQDKADTWLDYAKATGNHSQRLRYALQTYQVADRMIDYMRWEHTADRSKLYWREKTRGMYERAIETSYRLRDTEQAFRFFEKSRAVLLADKLNELGARQRLNPQQAEQERKIRRNIRDAQRELAGLTPDSTRYGTVRRALEDKQRQSEEFIKQLEQTNLTYFRYKYDTTTTKLTELQHYLRDHNASFVSYFVGDSAVYVLSVTGDGAKLQPLKQPVPAYKQNVQRFITLLSNRDSIRSRTDLNRFWALGNGIYQQVLAPLELPTGRVIVSPDRFFVPFDALSASTSKPDYLVWRYAFDYAYSARLLLRAETQSDSNPRPAKHDFIGFAPVTFARELNQVELPGSDVALKTIGERFPNAKLFTYQNATRAAFTTQAADAGSILLFTHAVADSTEPEPLLYFADGTLRLSDLANGGPLRARLAVLGACQTGVGADQVGEGVFSLARGFAELGVPSIVSTLWSVQDRSTYEITVSFHRYMDEGMPKDKALQRAKQDWLKDHPGNQDQLPNVWAGLILIGDAQPLRQPNRWPWIVILVLLAAGGAGLWWSRKRRAAPTQAAARPRQPLRRALINTRTLRRSS